MNKSSSIIPVKFERRRFRHPDVILLAAWSVVKKAPPAGDTALYLIP
jgi:hypothetical protein